MAERLKAEGAATYQFGAITAAREAALGELLPAAQALEEEEAAARGRRRRPSTPLFCRSTSAPRWISTSTTRSWPLPAAICSNVKPALSNAFTCPPLLSHASSAASSPRAAACLASSGRLPSEPEEATAPAPAAASPEGAPPKPPAPPATASRCLAVTSAMCCRS